MSRLILHFLLVLGFVASAGAATLTIRSDNWPPFNGDPKEVKVGYMIEVLKEIYAPLGDKVDYQLLSWDKSLSAVRKGQFNAVVGASKDDAPDFVYPQETFGINGNSFFVKAGAPWRYTGIPSLEKIRLGVIDSYSYEDDIDAYIKAQQGTPRIVSVSGDDPLPILIKKLQDGEIDAIVEDSNVMLYSLVKWGVPAGQITIAGSSTERVDLYVAFSPKLKSSREQAKAFDEGIARLRKNGKLQMILSRYGLQDWKK